MNTIQVPMCSVVRFDVWLLMSFSRTNICFLHFSVSTVRVKPSTTVVGTQRTVHTTVRDNTGIRHTSRSVGVAIDTTQAWWRWTMPTASNSWHSISSNEQCQRWLHFRTICTFDLHFLSSSILFLMFCSVCCFTECIFKFSEITTFGSIQGWNLRSAGRNHPVICWSGLKSR